MAPTRPHRPVTSGCCLPRPRYLRGRSGVRRAPGRPRNAVTARAPDLGQRVAGVRGGGVGAVHTRGLPVGGDRVSREATPPLSTRTDHIAACRAAARHLGPSTRPARRRGPTPARSHQRERGPCRHAGVGGRLSASPQSRSKPATGRSNASWAQRRPPRVSADDGRAQGPTCGSRGRAQACGRTRPTGTATSSRRQRSSCSHRRSPTRAACRRAAHASGQRKPSPRLEPAAARQRPAVARWLSHARRAAPST
jgi:hypothetical protein